MGSIQNNLVEADAEIAKGELWKAKEILHKSVKYAGYDVELYEKLGRVLLEMGDKVEAGKYLFLSGSTKTEYLPAIDLFLERYRGKPHNLFHPFPRAAKLQSVSDYPAPVAEKLRELGFGGEFENVHQIGLPSGLTRTSKLAFFIFVSIVLSILALIILGLIKLIEIVF